MMKIIKNFHQLDYLALSQVYERSLAIDGKNNYRHLSEYDQRRSAEYDFHDYLARVFFADKRNMMFILENQGHYVSALRLENYKNGYLITGLETKPCEYRKGFAKQLLREVIAYLKSRGGVVLYAHVDKNNTASLSAHTGAGFRILKDSAVLLDGTVTQNACTLCLKIGNDPE